MLRTTNDQNKFINAHCNDLFTKGFTRNSIWIPQLCPPSLSLSLSVCTDVRMHIYIYICIQMYFCSCLKTCFCCERCFCAAGSRGASAARMSGQLCSVALLTSDVSESVCVCVSVWARFACVRITSSFIKSAFGVCFVFPLCFDSLLIKKQLKQRQKIKQNRAVEMEMEIRYTHILNQFISILFLTSTAQVVLRVSDPSDWMVS